jgi:cytoskeleton protein RodZ
MPVLGERFRVAREARGLSLSEVSDQIRIRSVYLAAIEEERWSAIGAPVYVRGFLRTYARFLALDPEEIVTAFNAEIAPPEQSPEPTPVPRRSDRGPKTGPWLVWVASLVAMLLVAYVVFNALTMRRDVGPVATAASASPLAAASGPGAAESAAPSASPSSVPTRLVSSLALVFSAPTWLRVTVDGNVSMEGTFPAGTTKTFHGRTALVRLGNAGGVEIYVDGRDIGKLGKLGDVAERAFTL